MTAPTHVLTVQITIHPDPHDPERTAHELAAAVENWIEDAWGSTDPEFRHNRVTGARATVAPVPAPVLLEAWCSHCRTTFVPADESDLVHAECGTRGDLNGVYLAPRPDLPGADQ